VNSAVFIFVWVLLSVFFGKWNESRGNSFWSIFFISLLLSPLLGGLCVLLNPPDKQGVEEKILLSGEMKKCPACAELIKLEAIKCKHCGEMFEAVGNHGVKINQNKICLKCHTVNHFSNSYCENCGGETFVDKP